VDKATGSPDQDPVIKPTYEEKLEVSQNLRLLKPQDLSLLMAFLGARDEIDVGALEPSKFKYVRDFVNKKLPKVKISKTPKLPKPTPPVLQPERQVALASEMMTTLTDSEDEEILNTY